MSTQKDGKLRLYRFKINKLPSLQVLLIICSVVCVPLFLSCNVKEKKDVSPSTASEGTENSHSENSTEKNTQEKDVDIQTDNLRKKDVNPRTEKIKETNKNQQDEPTVMMKLQDDSETTQQEEAQDRNQSLRPNERFLPLRSGEMNLPEDFKIGPLQAIEVDGEIDEIIETVDSFFDALSRSEIDQGALHPDWKDIIYQRLFFHVQAGRTPKNIRLGEIVVSEEARANIRVFGEVGIAEGEIFLAQYDNNWYISDIQIDFLELDNEYVPKDSRFMPSSYRTLGIY